MKLGRCAFFGGHSRVRKLGWSRKFGRARRLDVVQIMLYTASAKEEAGLAKGGKGAAMGDVMVTGRMSAEKKKRGAKVLGRDGLSASQAINLMYDRLAEEGNSAFLTGAQKAERSLAEWRNAASFVDALSRPRESRFHSMTDAEIRVDRLRARGLM